MIKIYTRKEFLSSGGKLYVQRAKTVKKESKHKRRRKHGGGLEN